MSYADLATLLRRDRLRRSRWARTRAALGKFFVALIVAIPGALLGGWMLMLAVGIARAEWIGQLPTLGYWWAVLLTWLLRSALGTHTSPKSEGDR